MNPSSVDEIKANLSRVRIQNISRPTDLVDHAVASSSTSSSSPSTVISNKYFSSTASSSHLPVSKLRAKPAVSLPITTQQPLIFHKNRCHLQNGQFAAAVKGREKTVCKESDLAELLNSAANTGSSLQLKTSVSLSLPSGCRAVPSASNVSAAEHLKQQAANATPKAKNLTNLRDILKASHSSNNVTGKTPNGLPYHQSAGNQQGARSMSTKIPSGPSSKIQIRYGDCEKRSSQSPLAVSSKNSNNAQDELNKTHRWSETSLEDILKFSESDSSKVNSSEASTSANSPIDPTCPKVDEASLVNQKGSKAAHLGPQAVLNQIEKDLQESFSMLTKFNSSVQRESSVPIYREPDDANRDYQITAVKFRRNSVDKGDSSALKRLNEQVKSDRNQLANLSEISELQKAPNQSQDETDFASLARSASDKITLVDEKKCLNDYDIKESDLKELHEKFVRRIQGAGEEKAGVCKLRRSNKPKKSVQIEPFSLNNEYEFDPETIDLCKPPSPDKTEPEDFMTASDLTKSTASSGEKPTTTVEDMRSPLNEMCIRIRASLANDLKNQSSSSPLSSNTWNYDELNELRMKFISLLSSSPKPAQENQSPSESSEASNSSPSAIEAGHLSISTNEKSLSINTQNFKSDLSDSSVIENKPALNRSSMSFVSFSPQTISPAEQLIIESFYRSFGTNLYISESCASLFTMPMAKLTPIRENQASSPTSTASRIAFANQATALDSRTLQRNTLRRDEDISPTIIRDFINNKIDKYVSVYHRGVPLWLFNSGANPRRPYRQLKFTLAEKGTGFILWQDRIDSRSDFKIHLLRKSDQKIVGYASYCEAKLEKMKHLNTFEYDLSNFKGMLDELSDQYSSMLVSFRASDRKTAVLIKFDITDETVKFYEHYMQIIEKLNIEIKQRTKSLPIGVGINHPSILSGLSTGLSVAHSKQNNRNSLMSRIRFIPSTNTKESSLAEYVAPNSSATMSSRYSGLFNRRQSVYSTTSHGTAAVKSKKITKSSISQPCGLKHIIKIRQDDRDSFYTLSKLLPASAMNSTAQSSMRSSPSSIGPLTASSIKLSSTSPTSCVNKATPSPTASIASSSSVSASSDNSSSLMMSNSSHCSNKNESLNDYEKRCSSSTTSTKAQSPFGMVEFNATQSQSQVRSSVSNSSSCSSSSSLSISPSASLQQQPIVTITTSAATATVFRRNLIDLDKYKQREAVKTAQINASNQREILELTRKSMR